MAGRFPRPRVALRTRLALIYALVFVVSTSIVLAVSYALLAQYLRDTMPPGAADPILSKLAGKYVLALVGTTLIAVGAGWLAARKLLSPIQAITEAARHASDERLDRRVALGGPHDELRELGDTFDAMLDRFQESIEAQRRFIANASHELRSPLTAIRTEVDVTLADPDATIADLRRMGERVLEGGDQLDELLAALMVLARSQRGLLATTPVDLASIASIAIDDAQPAARRGQVELETHVAAAPVAGDPALLRRLIANLLDNAIRYNRPGGLVQLELGAADDGRVTIRVRNTGLVIAPADVARLREPFERLGRHGTGSGLGLSIVQAVAEAHEGTVTLATREEGGLDVLVSLPAKPSLAPSRETTIPPATTPRETAPERFRDAVGPDGGRSH